MGLDDPAITPLIRPMPSAAVPSWPGARWIGVLDDPPRYMTSERVPLADAGAYAHARLLVRDGGRVRGFVEAPIVDGSIAAADLAAAAAALPAAAAPVSGQGGAATVVLCTRDRPDQLTDALHSLLTLDHPDYDVLVVDNASRTDETRRVVERLAAGSAVPVRCIAEPQPGLARARNTGVRSARGELLAFTDDDIVADPQWLRRLADGFARHPDVACVTGLVPSGELGGPVQAYFEAQVSWASSCQARVFRMADPPPDLPLFPFRVGVFGTGANFAMRRADLLALGGFDEAFGAGSPTKGGEDIDMFVRVVIAGHALAFEPSAVIWHRHRADAAALEAQAIGYGLGLGAWLTKVALDRSTNTLALRRVAAGLRRARALTAATTADELDPQMREALAKVDRAGRAALLRGPAAYLRARRQGLRRAPLAGAAPSRLGGAAPLRRAGP